MHPVPTLLIGYGSIGRYHARVLAERATRMAIVDFIDGVHEAIRTDHPEAVVARTLAELRLEDWPWEDTVAVIATWGPSHAALFEELVDLGVRRILCEKPLAHSVAAGSAMLRVAREEHVALGVHQRLRYMGLAAGLRAVSREWGLGEPVGIVVCGGAMCLVTNGIHYIDLASELFGAAPRSVISSAVGAHMNPRSPSLMYYGGTAVWSYGDDREAVITFTNHASLRAAVSIYFPHGVIEMRPTLDVTVRCRPAGDVQNVPMTRTGMPTETLYEGPLPGVRPGLEATAAVLDEVTAGSVRIFPPDAALDAVTACIGALIAGRSGHSVALPIPPDSVEGREEWPIS